MLTIIPSNYNRRITMATGPKVKKPEPPKPRASEYLDRLDLAEAATVVFPLSEKIRVIFARYSDGSLDEKTEGRRVPTRYVPETAAFRLRKELGRPRKRRCGEVQ